jgi:hypothetical protein
MKTLLKNNILFVLYTIVFVILMYGVSLTSGTKYLDELLVYYVSLLAFYLILKWVSIKTKLTEWLSNLKLVKFDFKPLYLLVPVLLFILIHLIIMGGSPTLKALSLDTWQEVSKLRESLGEGVHPLIGYGSSITLKAALPFLLLYFFVKDNKLWYWIIFVVGTFYVFSMMQKSFVVGFLFPTMVYAFLKKKYLYGLKHIVVMVLVVVGLSKIANPNVATEKADLITDNHEAIELVDTIPVDTTTVEQNFEEVVENADKTPSRITTLLYGLQRRVLIVPGKIVSAWFDHIPENKPFLNGNGYRVVAKLKGEEHRSYASELYPLINPKYAAQGFKGTVNSASFMYDYANFGLGGLVLSGFILALVFIFVESFYAGDFILKLSLNLYPLLFLTSTAITTLMFSGGWAFFILFYYLFLFNKKAEK